MYQEEERAGQAKGEKYVTVLVGGGENGGVSQGLLRWVLEHQRGKVKKEERLEDSRPRNKATDAPSLDFG